MLEATIDGYPEQAKLLEEVIAGPCFTAAEFPEVTGHLRKPPQRKKMSDKQGELPLEDFEEYLDD